MKNWISIVEENRGTVFKVRQDRHYALRLACYAVAFVLLYYFLLLLGLFNTTPDGSFGVVTFVGILLGIVTFPLQFGLLFFIPFAVLCSLMIKGQVVFSINAGNVEFVSPPRKAFSNFYLPGTHLKVSWMGRGLANKGYAVSANVRGEDMVVAEALTFQQAEFLHAEMIKAG